MSLGAQRGARSAAWVAMRWVIGRATRTRSLAAASLIAAAAVLCLPALAVAQAVPVPPVSQTIARIKPSVVAVGTWQKTRTPAFRFLGTGFGVGDGSLVATNAHVLPPSLDAGAQPESLVIVVPSAAVTPQGASEPFQVRAATRVAVDPEHDLAVLKIAGAPIAALKLRDSERIEEGESFLFTGFPIGAVLGLHAATHRAMVSVITPIVLPPAHSSQLEPRAIKRLQSGAFPVIQLDATAYPGNSGSPLYDGNGEVVGIINMVFVKGTKESALSQPSGITYAIPATHLRALLATAR